MSAKLNRRNFGILTGATLLGWQQMAGAVRRADLCKKDREQTCVDLEKKKDIPKGTVWIVDFEKKVLKKRS